MTIRYHDHGTVTTVVPDKMFCSKWQLPTSTLKLIFLPMFVQMRILWYRKYQVFKGHIIPKLGINKKTAVCWHLKYEVLCVTNCYLWHVWKLNHTYFCRKACIINALETDLLHTINFGLNNKIFKCPFYFFKAQYDLKKNAIVTNVTNI